MTRKQTVAILCDLCGLEQNLSDDLVGIGWHRMYVEKLAITTSLYVSNKASPSVIKYINTDLCPVCSKNFLTWFPTEKIHSSEEPAQ